MANFTLTIETVAPIHIGSGRADLYRDIDFVVHGNYVYVLDVDAVLEAVLPADERDPRYDQVLNTHNLGSFLPKMELDAKPALVRYTSRQVPTTAQIRAQTVDSGVHAYVPGSSLKGALRTAWLRTHFEGTNKKIVASDLGERAEYAFRRTEESVLSPGRIDGRTAPNRDLFRAVQITDSHPFERSASSVYNVVVVPAGQKGIPIAVEGIKPRQTTTARLKFDDYLLNHAAEQLGWGNAAHGLTNLITICQEQGIKRIHEERTFWESRAPEVEKFYADLATKADQREPNTCYIEVGWGSGWMSKTLGRVLRDDRPLLAQLMRRYRLNRGTYHDGDAFPKTRRAIRDQEGVLRVPMGWVKLSVGM